MTDELVGRCRDSGADRSDGAVTRAAGWSDGAATRAAGWSNGRCVYLSVAVLTGQLSAGGGRRCLLGGVTVIEMVRAPRRQPATRADSGHRTELSRRRPSSPYPQAQLK